MYVKKEKVEFIFGQYEKFLTFSGISVEKNSAWD